MFVHEILRYLENSKRFFFWDYCENDEPVIDVNLEEFLEILTSLLFPHLCKSPIVFNHLHLSSFLLSLNIKLEKSFCFVHREMKKNDEERNEDKSGVNKMQH